MNAADRDPLEGAIDRRRRLNDPPPPHLATCAHLLVQVDRMTVNRARSSWLQTIYLIVYAHRTHISHTWHDLSAHLVIL